MAVAAQCLLVRQALMDSEPHCWSRSAGDELENYNLMLYPPTNFPSAQTNVTIVRFLV